MTLFFGIARKILIDGSFDMGDLAEVIQELSHFASDWTNKVRKSFKDCWILMRLEFVL